MLNNISDKDCLIKATKDGTKWPATNQISLMYLGVSKERVPKPTFGGDKQGHEQRQGEPYSSSSGFNQAQ